jgi:hypothetical protein
MKSNCVFSADRRYRYSLHHSIEGLFPTGRLAMFIGLNPSTADEFEPDATIRIVRNLAIMHGCDSFVMTNLFAFRATDPREMLRQLDPIGPGNDDILEAWAGSAAIIVCCWGAWGNHLQRGAKVTKLLARHDLRCLALTSKGMPRHPLRLARTNQLLPLPHAAAES